MWKKNQIVFKSKLSNRRIDCKKSDKQENKIENMNFTMHNTRSSRMIFNAGSDATHRKGLKIQLVNKCFKKLSIALA